MQPLLEVTNLETHYVSFGGARVIKAVDDVSFTLNEGETLGIVGESGCGKTTTCLSIVGLLPPAARIVGGRIEFAGKDLARLSQREMRRIRGAQIAMILQDPMASLNPLFSIYTQVAEPAYYHQSIRGRSLRQRVRQLLDAVRIPSPAQRMREYPHQMSGGMRQRIVGAIALAGGPRVVIADEPTTNLDVTIQAQYLDLLKDIQRETGVALIFVTHNLGIVAKMCDRVAVMYAGKIVEQAPVRLIGESGCGKTTTSRLILRTETPTAGTILFEGRDVAGLDGAELMAYRRQVQVVFQDPFSSLSPRMRVRDIIAEPLEIHTDLSRQELDQRVAEVLELVGLEPELARLFPHEFSGGQRQRIAIARALATNTRLIVLDEPVSALDVSIRAQIITQLEQLQQTLGVSYLFIGHDLATVAHISHRIAVMYLGQIVESADSDALCARPMHPYTQALFAAALPSHPDDPQGERTIAGEVPSAMEVPSGCRFHPRCPAAMPVCSEAEPALEPRDGSGEVACHLYRVEKK